MSLPGSIESVESSSDSDSEVLGTAAHNDNLAQASAEVAPATQTLVMASPNGSPSLAVPSSNSPLQTPSRANGEGRAPVDRGYRNPIPRVLREVDHRAGNFAVEHMSNAARQAHEREEQARRTSERIQEIAKEAERTGYQPTRRRAQVFIPPEPIPSHPSQYPPRVKVQPPERYQQHPYETKAEQSRLLRFVRTLHPNLVVDRLCKALVFFGGTPDAPPPRYGVFPESALGNGTGTNFIGWMSEIFPMAQGEIPPEMLAPTGPVFSMPPQPPQQWQEPQPQPPPSASLPQPNAGYAPPTHASQALGAPPAPGRKRGRPLGSKSTKTRKDKGIRRVGRGDGHEEGAGDGAGGAPPGVAPSTDMTMRAAGTSGSPIVVNDESHFQPQQGPSSAQQTPTSQSVLDVSQAQGSTPGSKKRGRPRGSKNRPRAAGEGTQADPLAITPDSTARLNSTHATGSPTKRPRILGPPQQPPSSSMGQQPPVVAQMQYTQANGGQISDNENDDNDDDGPGFDLMDASVMDSWPMASGPARPAPPATMPQKKQPVYAPQQSDSTQQQQQSPQGQDSQQASLDNPQSLHQYLIEQHASGFGVGRPDPTPTSQSSQQARDVNAQADSQGGTSSSQGD